MIGRLAVFCRAAIGAGLALLAVRWLVGEWRANRAPSYPASEWGVRIRPLGHAETRAARELERRILLNAPAL